MRDFTLTTYKKLLTELLQAGYGFMTFTEFVETKPGEMKLIILRHDVDKKPLQSLITAEIENKLGIKGTYYFKVDKNVFHSEVIECIAELGHEIGYHYDDLNAADGVLENALYLFQKNLAKLRKLALIKTACMHGSPLSRHDNKDLWKNFDYHELGIIGEPYFDIDFNEVLYLTDTGRRWDGGKVSIRDKVIGNGQHKLSTDFGGSNLSVSSGTREVMGDGDKKIGDGQEARGYREDRGQKTEDRGQKTENKRPKEEECRGAVCDPPVLHHEIVDSTQETVVSSKKKEAFKGLKLHSTMDIIKALKNDHLPNKIMLTVHPQRWTDQWIPWFWELGWQKVKNCVKYILAKKVDSSQ